MKCCRQRTSERGKFRRVKDKNSLKRMFAAAKALYPQKGIIEKMEETASVESG